MVQVPTTQEQTDGDEEQITYAEYTIDPEAATAAHRSLPVLIASRRCYMDQQGDDDVANLDEDLNIKRIAEHCSKEQDYLLEDTPLKEAIFRVLLSEANRPMTAEEISEVLTSKWAMTPFPRNTSPEVIQRLLDNARNYCIARVPDPEPEPQPEPIAEPDEPPAEALPSESEASTESQPSPDPTESQ